MRLDDESGAYTPPYDDRIWKTLVRYSRPPLSEGERRELEHWVADDATRRAVVRAVQRLAAAARARRSESSADTAWARVSARLPNVEAHRERLQARMRQQAKARRLRFAAMLALAACVTIMVVRYDDALSRLFDAVAARFAPEPEHVVATGIGERNEVHLADGSTVVLGPASRLRYGKLVGARTRTMHLEGEGYFTVAPDRAHPFIVVAGHAAVEAVGTAFDVTAYPGNTIVQVVTTHGTVALRPVAARTGAGALVERGERGTLDTAGVARIVAGVNVDRAIAWTEGRLSYQLEPLDEVARDLHRWYGLDIVVTDSALARLRITMTLDHATADDVVQRLVETLGVRYHRTGNTVRLGE